MKNKYTFVILIAIVLFFIGSNYVSAVNVEFKSSGQKFISTYGYWEYSKDDKDVYCVLKGAADPVNYSCSSSYTNYSDATRAAIGYIIHNYSSDYAKTQYIIHRTLQYLENGSAVGYYGVYFSEYDTAVNVAQNYKNEVPGTYYLANLYSCGTNVQPIAIADDYETITIPHKLTIIYHSNGATTKELEGVPFTDDNNIPEHTVKKGVNATYGLNNVQNSYYLYLTRTGYTPTGKWLLGSTTSTTKLDQEDPITWSGSKAMIGSTEIADLSSGDQTIHVYAEWVVNRAKILYHPNGGIITEQNGYSLNHNNYISLNGDPHFHQVTYGNMTDPYNANNVETFNLRRPGYTFTGWKVDASNEILDHNTKYGSLKYVQYNDKTKTTANTAVVECVLRAQWQLNDIEIIYHGNSGYTSGGNSTYSHNLVYGNNYTIEDGTRIFNRNGFMFIGWTTNSDGKTSDGYSWAGTSSEWIWQNKESIVQNDELNLYARWQDACEYEFENTYNNSPTILQRMNMYRTYGRKNLLNFTIPEATEACNPYSPDYGTEENCLSVKYINDNIKGTINENDYTPGNFSAQNLSDYNEELIDSTSGTHSYCLVDFTFEKEDTVNYDPSVSVKAGQMIINLEKDAVFATAKITKICYMHKDVYGNHTRSGQVSYDYFINVDDYFSNIILDDNILIKDQEIVKIPRKLKYKLHSEGEFYRAHQIATIKYYLNPVYAEIMTGKPMNMNDCIDKGTGEQKPHCRILGYGVASKFNDAKLEKDLSFNFKIEPLNNSQSLFTFNSNNVCEYKVEPEVITYENNSQLQGELELEFRTIDTNNPFNRNSNSNWCNGSDCGQTNSIIQKYIIDANNSYNKTGSGSIYTNQGSGTRKIILTPTTINQIREDNKINNYDKYETTCDGNGVCTNAFLQKFQIIKTS